MRKPLTILMAWLVLVILVAVLLLPLRSSHLEPSEAPPTGPLNVLLVSLDTTRPDRLEACGEAGPAVIPTPALDRIRGEGFVFTGMIAPAPITLPSHTSLFTGVNPYRHGVRENTEFRLPPGTPTLAAALGNAGYTTAAFLASFVLDKRFGLDAGFDTYEDRLSGPEAGLHPYTVELPGEIVAARAARWLNGYRGEAPFFLFVHFFDAHAPYRPPPPFSARYPDRPYAGELAYQDRCLGMVLDALEGCGQADRTLVWVVSDHGESLGEHGEATHGLFLYDATLRVVSILRLPPSDGRLDSGRPKRTLAQAAGLIDVAPTLLDLCGLPAGPMATVEGRSLVPLLRGGEMEARAIYAETLSPRFSYHWAPLHGVRTAEWKYIRCPEPELYNLAADPAEGRNVLAQHPEVAARMEDELDGFLADASAPDARRRLSPQERERLESLGYVAGSGREPDPADALPNPKRMVAFFEAEYQRAKDLIYAGRHEQAATVLKQALRVDPLNNALHFNLASALRYGGHPAEAGRSYREAIRIEPRSSRAWYGWSQALLAVGEADSAAWACERALALLPRAPEYWMGLGDARWRQRRFEQAAAAYDSALVNGGDAMRLHGLLARLWRVELKDAARASEHLASFARLTGLSPAEAERRLPPGP